MALPLPSKVVATYFTLWGGGSRITSVPLDYNQIYLFHAVPVGGGAFRFDYGAAVTAAEIATCQGRGQRVVLTVGGANAGFNFQTRAQSDAFVESFKQMNATLGGQLSGCDFNNFEAFVGSSGTEMAYIGRRLKEIYGANFSISCPPHPGGGYAPMDRQITKAMSDAGVLDYAGPQFYDSPDLTQATTIIALIKEWVTHLGSAKKVVVGLTSNYGAGPTLATCQTVWKTLAATYPDLRGVFAWSAQDDAKGGWAWGKSMGTLVKAGSAPAPAPAPAPTPAPTPVPAPTGAVQWVAGTRYPLGTIVIKDGKYYKLGQVDSTGTSSGTDPAVSTWYWQPIAAPTPTPTPAPAPVPTPTPTPTPVPAFVVGDRVKTGTNTGTITAISGANATVRLDTVVTVATSTLTKI